MAITFEKRLPMRTCVGTRVRRWDWLAIFVGLMLAAPTVVCAQAPKAVHSASHESLKATSSREAQENAIQSIPFDKIDAASRAKVSAVLADVTLFRRLPVDVMPCDPNLYLFLLDHPDVVVDIWQTLGISRITLKQIGPEVFQITDDAGTTGTVQVLYHDQNTRVIFTEGSYNGPLFGRQLQGRILIVLKSAYIWRPDGRCYVTTRLDSFTQLDNIGMEIITKTIQPLVGKTADINFLQTTSFVASLSRTAEVNQPGLLRLAKRLPQIQPEVREQFVQLVEQMGPKPASTPGPTAEASAAVAERTASTTTR
jgi:hypothetical protein